MIDRHGGWHQDIPEDLKGLFPTNAIRGNGLPYEFMQFFLFSWFTEFRIPVGDTTDGIFHDIQGHLYRIQIYLVHSRLFCARKDRILPGTAATAKT